MCQERSVNLRLFQGAAATARVLRSGKAISSGPYRSGCCVIQKRLSAGCHTIVVSTFRQGETGEFQVSLHLWNAQAPVTNGKNEGKIVSTCDLKPQFWSTGSFRVNAGDVTQFETIFFLQNPFSNSFRILTSLLLRRIINFFIMKFTVVMALATLTFAFPGLAGRSKFRRRPM